LFTLMMMALPAGAGVFSGKISRSRGMTQRRESWPGAFLGIDRELLAEGKLDDRLVLAIPEEGENESESRNRPARQRMGVGDDDENLNDFSYDEY
jgi:hypothetical protein